MRILQKGLIVSCYLESLRGCEKEFIACVINHPHVVAVRVEGLDNIKWARLISPNAFIIGLVKDMIQGKTYITDKSEIVNILTCGANMVATEEIFYEWKIPSDTQDKYEYDIIDIDNETPIMLDLSRESLAQLKRCYDKDWMIANFINDSILAGTLIFSTTYEHKAFDMIKEIRDIFPNALVNLEGKIETQEEILKGFAMGADYITIGKAINDPPTIINNLLANKFYIDNTILQSYNQKNVYIDITD